MHDAEKKESLAAENKRFFIMYFRLPEEEEGGEGNFSLGRCSQLAVAAKGKS